MIFMVKYANFQFFAKTFFSCATPVQSKKTPNKTFKTWLSKKVVKKAVATAKITAGIVKNPSLFVLTKLFFE